jgi:hypothetical protein
MALVFFPQMAFDLREASQHLADGTLDSLGPNAFPDSP